MSTDVGVMIVTAALIAIIIAIGYLYLNQRAQATATLPGATGSTAGGSGNANAWTRLFGATLQGVGTGLGGGGF